MCITAERREPLATSRLDQCAVALAGSVLYKNWQRPGAVCNATLRQIAEAKVMAREGLSLYVMSIELHNTSMEGYAKVVLEGLDHSRITHYIHMLRPLEDPLGQSNISSS